jgi:hypothetical protein
MPNNNNSCEVIIGGGTTIFGFDIGIYSRIDHLRVMDCEMPYWGTHAIDIEPINGGGPIYNHIRRVHSFRGGQLNGGAMIYDNRALFSYGTTQGILVLEEIANESPAHNNPNYANAQGAYYVARLPNLLNNPYGAYHYQTNLPGQGAKSSTDDTGDLMQFLTGTGSVPYTDLGGNSLTVLNSANSKGAKMGNGSSGNRGTIRLWDATKGAYYWLYIDNGSLAISASQPS